MLTFSQFNAHLFHKQSFSMLTFVEENKWHTRLSIHIISCHMFLNFIPEKVKVLTLISLWLAEVQLPGYLIPLKCGLI